MGLFLKRKTRCCYNNFSEQTLQGVYARLLMDTVRLQTENSTMAAYGAILSAVRDRGALALMKQEQKYLEETLKTSLLLRNYYEEKGYAAEHKQRIGDGNLKDAYLGMEEEYQALLTELVVHFNESNVSKALATFGLGRASEDIILQRITACLFLALAEIGLPEDTSESRFENFTARQKEIEKALGQYLGVTEVQTEKNQSEEKKVFQYQIETREENETRIPLRKRLSGEIKSIDIAVLGGISLLSSKRHLLDRLLKERVPIRFVVTDPESIGGAQAIRQFMDFSTDVERAESMEFALTALSSRERRYSTLECRKTDLALPQAIFIVHKENAKESSVKIDFYSFRTLPIFRSNLNIYGSMRSLLNQIIEEAMA